MVIPYVSAMSMPMPRSSSSSKKKYSYSRRVFNDFYLSRERYNIIINSINGICNNDSNIYDRHKRGYDICMKENSESISDQNLPASLRDVRLALDNDNIFDANNLLDSWKNNYPQYGYDVFKPIQEKMDEDKRRRWIYSKEDAAEKLLKEKEQQRKEDEETEKYRSENFENRYVIFYLACAYFLYKYAKEIALSYNNYRRIKPFNIESFIFGIIFDIAYRLLILYMFYCILRCFPRL